MSSPSSRPQFRDALDEALDDCLRNGVAVSEARATFLRLHGLAIQGPSSTARTRASVVLAAASETMDESATPGLVTMVLVGVKRILGVHGLHDARAHQDATKLAADVVMDRLPYSVFFKDEDGFYLFVNKRFAAIAGLSPEELIGRCDLELAWAPSETLGYLLDDELVRASGEPRLNIEEPQHRADGTTTYLLTSKVPVPLPWRDAVGVLGIFTDITSRRETELALEEAKRVAERASEVKDTFLATMSHEIRTPLSLIIAPIEKLIGEELDDERRRVLRRLLRNAERLEELVTDVLDFTKSRSSVGIELEQAPFDAVATIAELVDASRPAAEAKGLELELSRPPGLRVRGDRKRLQQIVANLVSNGIKFTPRGGRVSVTVSLGDEASMRLVVMDTGIGVAPEDQARIFERFQQAESSMQRRHEGTGIGLALVKELVRAMDGEVTLESELGRGTKVVVDLPIVTTSEDGDTGSTPPEVATRGILSPAVFAPLVDDPPPTAGPWVLVVEDNRDLAAMLCETLVHHYPVRHCTNGASALAYLEDCPLLPAAVLSDLMMPEMDGLELLRHIRGNARMKDVPVLLLTARGDEEVLAAALDAGANDYMNKPFRSVELRARVRSAVRAHELQCEVLAARRAEEEGRHWANLARVLAQTSHEINNPLTVIRCNLQSLAEFAPLFDDAGRVVSGASKGQAAAQLAELAEDFEDVVAESLHAVDRIQAIQRDLRVFVRRDEAPASSREKSVWPIGPVVAQVVAERARREPTSVEFDDGGAAQTSVSGERHHLEQILHNLIGNALEATGEGGHVEVVLMRDGQEVEVAVQDDGPGMDEEALASCFEPFFTTKAFGVGTGLGLAVVKQLAQRLGGTVTVAHREDSTGCVFRLRLPLPEVV